MAEQHTKGPTWKVLGILFLLLVVPVIWVILNKTGEGYSTPLPILGERDLDENGDTVYHTISDFKLVNQNGDSVSLATYKNKILLVSFFFASCETVCPRMNSYIGNHIYSEFKKDTSIVFLSFSVDPENDTPEVLKEYAKGMGAQSNWHFLTGSKRLIYKLAEESFKIPGAEGGHQNLFHSDKIVVVDKELRLRGAFETGGQNDKMKTLDAVRALKLEYKPNAKIKKK